MKTGTDSVSSMCVFFFDYSKRTKSRNEGRTLCDVSMLYRVIEKDVRDLKPL